jgi:hypothetical protein
VGKGELSMTLKDVLELIPIDEIISIYDVPTNTYLYFEQLKEDCHGEYDNCVVVRIGGNLTNGYYPVLEIEILTQQRNDVNEYT